jgi:hypothetical protein
MDPQVAPLATLFELNTDLLLNCLEGLTDAEAQRRLEAGGNSVTFSPGNDRLSGAARLLPSGTDCLPSPAAGQAADVLRSPTPA